MRKWVLATIGCLSLVAGGRSALAATTDGTLITNVACGTFQSASGIGFAISYCCTATVIVSNPCVSLQKSATPTLQSSGGYVTFQLIAKECGCTTSAFNIMVTDRLPDNMALMSVASTNVMNWGGGTAPIHSLFSSTNNVNWNANWPGTLGQLPPFWLWWQLEYLGPCKSSSISFLTTVQ